MISSFDLSKLNALLEDFYTMTHIRITVFDDDFNELAAYPASVPQFCGLIRSTEDGLERCRKCDAAACETAARRRALYTYQCHAGMTESITPIIVGNIVIGYLFFGHLLSYPSHEDAWEAIERRCRDYPVSKTDLKMAVWRHPLISRDYISSASHIMQAVAAYLCMERMVSLRQQALPVQIDEYIHDHYAEPIDALAIAGHFHIGKTQLYKVAQQSYGCGIAEYIRGLRIEKAKEMLKNDTELSVQEIADACGFSDYNYFITVFRKTVGVPPKAFRHTDTE